MKTTIIIKVEKYRLDSSDDNVDILYPQTSTENSVLFCLVLYNFGHLMGTCN